jgi:hypothetical protein
VVSHESLDNLGQGYPLEVTMKTKEIKTIAPFISSLIAPCGMDCRLCMAYGRAKNPCPGCYGELKSKSRDMCRIRKCEKRTGSRTKYCFDCNSYPCARLKHLDLRYRTKYGMSMLENLENIRQYGIRNFVKTEKEKWACSECGVTLCVHRPQCPKCQHKWR